MTAELGRRVAFNARLDAGLTTLFVGVTLVVVLASPAGMGDGDPRPEGGPWCRRAPFVETAYAG